MALVKKRILVIDDEENICELFNDFLKAEGHISTVATSPEDGLSAAYQKEWDLVFLDLSLPRMDGWDVLRGIQKMHPGIKVVITTGYPCEAIRKEALRFGIVDFLQKPFKTEDISALITKHCP